MLTKQLQLDKGAQAEIISALVGMPVMLLLAWTGAGVWALVFGGIAQAVVRTIIIFAFHPWWPRFRFTGRRIPAMLRYSMSAVGANLGWSLYSQMDSLIVGKLTNEQTLGIYSMAKQLAIMPVTKVSVVINQLAGPVMARLQHDQERLRALFLKVVRLVTCVTLPLCVGLGLVAHDFILVVLGEKWWLWCHSSNCSASMASRIQ